MKIGVADTLFSRGDMGSLAMQTLREQGCKEVIRVTVPGFKDLPVAAKKLLEEQGCDLVVALGMAGSAPIDETCAHEASLGLIAAQLLTNKHVLTVFVHEREAKNDAELAEIMRNRTVRHCVNAVKMLSDPEWLVKRAGTGERQGKENAEPVNLS